MRWVFQPNGNKELNDYVNEFINFYNDDEDITFGEKSELPESILYFYADETDEPFHIYYGFEMIWHAINLLKRNGNILNSYEKCYDNYLELLEKHLAQMKKKKTNSLEI